MVPVKSMAGVPLRENSNQSKEQCSQMKTIWKVVERRQQPAIVFESSENLQAEKLSQAQPFGHLSHSK